MGYRLGLLSVPTMCDGELGDGKSWVSCLGV